MPRTHNQLRRIFTLIDSIAHLRLPFSTEEAKEHVEEKTRNPYSFSIKTLERDMKLLLDMSFIEIHREGSVGIPALYRVSPIAIKNVAAAARTQWISESQRGMQ